MRFVAALPAGGWPLRKWSACSCLACSSFCLVLEETQQFPMCCLEGACSLRIGLACTGQHRRAPRGARKTSQASAEPAHFQTEHMISRWLKTCRAPRLKRLSSRTRVREQETPDGRFKSRLPLHLILGDSIVEYGSRLFSIYFLLYYCSVHAYFPDESTV